MKKVSTVLVCLSVCITILSGQKKTITNFAKLGLESNMLIVYNNDSTLQSKNNERIIHTINFLDSSYSREVYGDNNETLFLSTQPQKVTELSQYKERDFYNIRFKHNGIIYHFFAFDTEGGKIQVHSIILSVNQNCENITRSVLNSKDDALIARLFRLKYKMYYSKNI